MFSRWFPSCQVLHLSEGWSTMCPWCWWLTSCPVLTFFFFLSLFFSTKGQFRIMVYAGAAERQCWERTAVLRGQILEGGYNQQCVWECCMLGLAKKECYCCASLKLETLSCRWQFCFFFQYWNVLFLRQPGITCAVHEKKRLADPGKSSHESISARLCADRTQRWRTSWCFSTPRKKLWSASSTWKTSRQHLVHSREANSRSMTTGWAPPPCSRYDESSSDAFVGVVEEFFGAGEGRSGESLTLRCCCAFFLGSSCWRTSWAPASCPARWPTSWTCCGARP